MSEWRLIHPLREWQQEALGRWLAGRRGVIEVVTGGGKTVFAFSAMLALRAEVENLRFLIIVPSLALADQWVVSLQDELLVPVAEIGIYGGGERPKPEHTIIVAVVNSIRGRSRQIAADHSTMLVVDECHRLGANKNATALLGPFVATLGLSATPERDYDQGFEEYIRPALGTIIYNYGYVQAARDKVIAAFNLTNVEISMLDTERDEYARLSSALARARREAVDENDERVRRLLIRRAAVVNHLTYRVPVAVRIIDQHRGVRSIVFHERVLDAERITKLLRERSHNVTIYHAGIAPGVRREHLRRFRAGVYDVLVCCRALDEGTNVPETAIAVVASGSASRRQRIQRLGRILRPAAGKTHADVYTLFATGEERDRLLQESEQLAEVAGIRWMRMKARGEHGAAAA